MTRRRAFVAMFVFAISVVAPLAAAGMAGTASAQTATTAATTTTTPKGPGIYGVLSAGDKPVAGVHIVVRRGAQQVGEATSDAAGRFDIRVPGPGTYRVTLDTKTIPKGFELVNPKRTELPNFLVFGTIRQRVLFPFKGGAAAKVENRFDRILNLIVSGLRFGLIVGVCSVGLSLVYGTTGLVNFAHGELVTLGALIAWFFNANTGGPRLTLIVAALLAVVLSGALGGALDLGLWRPLARKRTGAVSRMLVSIGLALFLRYLYQVVFGGTPRTFRQYAAQGPTSFGPITQPVRNYIVMVVCAAALVLVALALERTRLGTAVRAVADERDLAEASGIDVRRVITVVWAGGAALTGLGGILLALTEGVQWNMGFRLLLTMFAAVVLGGLGSAYGAMAGALVVGVASELSTYWIDPDFKFAVALLILIVVLLFRPQGILGVRSRVG
ncbi:MAG: branched-chain amino acid transport system permease protein [Actinomycetota bacterium]|nr:branched-chain amino acid transport system permease protein [Actinomycetota bacterium]